MYRDTRLDRLARWFIFGIHNLRLVSHIARGRILPGWELPRVLMCAIGDRHLEHVTALKPSGTPAHSSSNFAFIIINITLIVAACTIFVYFRWDDLSNWDVRTYAFAAIDFTSHPRLYERAYVDKPPLAFLMFLPMAFLPTVAGPAIFFAMVIIIEALLLRRLLLLLGFDEAACLGGVALLLTDTTLKYQLDYVSLSHLTNLLILGACTAANKGKIRGIIISGVLIGASFYIRQNNVIFALYPLILGRLTDFRLLAIYTISMLTSLLFLLGLFCLISDVPLLLYTIFAYPFKYADVSVGGRPPTAVAETALFFGILSLKPLLLFVVVWCVAALTGARPPVSGRQMVLLFAVGFIAMVAPRKEFWHYQGYLLIWLGLLGAWSVEILVPRFLRHRQSLLVCLAAGCAVALVVAVAGIEAGLRQKIASAKDRLNLIMPEIEKARSSRPGHPTLQVFEPVYDEHGISDALILALTDAKTSTPLFATVFFADWFSFALPPPFRSQWGLLAKSPPDVVVLIDLASGGSVGVDFARSVNAFLDSHGYRVRRIADDVAISERPNPASAIK